MNTPVAARFEATPATGASSPEPASQNGSQRARAGVMVGVPAALATALCLIGLPARSLGFDEGATVAIVAQHGTALGSAIAHDGGNMLGYYEVLHVLTGLFGSSTFVLRVPSALATGLTVLLVGLLARRLFDNRIALVSGLLAAVSLSLVFWGQSARGYAPMIALITASFLAFVVLVDGEASSRRAWLAYLAFTTLAVYASFVAVLVLPAQLITLLWRRRATTRVISALAVSALCCTPLLALALNRGSGQLFWLPRPNATLAKQVLEALTSSGLQPSFRATVTTASLLVLTLGLIGLITARLVPRLSRGADERAVWGQALALTWLATPVLLAWFESLFGQPIFVPRNLLVALPAVALLLGSGLADRRVPGPLTWSLVAALLALRLLQLVPSYNVSPENWRAATSYVRAWTRAGDCVAFYPSDGRMAFGYYVGSSRAAAARAPRPVLPAAPWTQVRSYVESYVGLSAAQVDGIRAGCPRLWFISSHQGQLDGPAGARANHARYLSLRATLEAGYARRRTASFGYASPVRVELLAH